MSRLVFSGIIFLFALTLFSLPIVIGTAFAQDPQIQWQNTIGGNNEDRLYSIQQTADGGYICGGRSVSSISGDKTENSQGSHDYWIVKLDASGNIQWQNTIGGGGWDELLSIQQTVDGGYICGGGSSSNISGNKTENSWGFNDYWVVKVDSAGNIQWQNTIGGNGGDLLTSIQQTDDGGYICGGSSSSNISGDKTENSQGSLDYWIVKLDASGNVTWQNTIGGIDVDGLESIQQTADGGYICGGSSSSNISGDKTENSQGHYDYWVVKLDSSGNIQWQNTLGGYRADNLNSIQQTLDGGFICGGTSTSDTISGDKTENHLGYYAYWVVKLTAAGNIAWQNTISGNGGDLLKAIQQTADGGYICGGYSHSDISGDKTENNQGIADYWIVKLDTSGSIQWQNTIGGNSLDILLSIQQTTEGGYICGGYSDSPNSGDKTENSQGIDDYWVVKLKNDSCLINPISLTYSKSSVTCFGANDGSAQVNISGGVLPYNYMWNTNPVQTTTQITNLNQGIYTISISDSIGCTKTKSFVINEPLPFQVFAIPQITNPPGSATGSINLLVTGGAGPYNYNWTTGATTEDISNLIPGVYTVTVTDAHGCAEILSVVIQ